MKINDILKVKIIDVDNFGNGVAKVNDIVIFIPKTLKDEIVNIKIVKDKKKYFIAEVLEIIEKSKDRIEVKCPYYDKCGGCNFLHTTIENEKRIKESYINKLFYKFNISVSDLLTEESYNYRNKVTLHVKNNKLGYYQKKSNLLVEIDNCLILEDPINKYIKILSKYNLKNIKDIMVKTFENKVMIKINGYLEEKDLIDILKNEDLNSLYFDDKLIYNNEYLLVNIKGKKYSIYPDSFFQVNTKGMIRLYDIIKENASGNNLLDLYCGTGTIGIYVSENFDNILGVEISKTSIKNAEINKKINKLDNINFICSDSDKIKGKYDFVIVDPPRSGLSKKVIQNLIDINSKKIIYVSCNPSTLVRNINMLIGGYDIKSIMPVNMFPRTEHVECVCLLNRR